MSDIIPVMPRLPAPDLEVVLSGAGGAHFSLADEAPETFTLVVFYRGYHCPICRTQLRELEANLPEFEKRGVSVVAVSSDSGERAAKAKTEWNLPHLRLGYGLDLNMARRWGLYVSAGRGATSIGVEEPALFSEPGLFLIRPDHTVYFASVQSMPFARPHFTDILGAIDFVVAKSYPARGEVASLV
ncbi:MAG: redoxin domain-containing protein [Beijerinckiaceae bacterium]|nr:redoxin domain-containing protein [Beijerinckiaceae bacterium]